ncbi:RTA1 like protein-domain-containing protein [Aspergillus cavernicola]|uniref:RTA1 like protein-domain-containing protein n=1 Tax=Aspergillus cavernicola TaxID=176166 RepID=A0ABR4I8Q9_9EURO
MATMPTNQTLLDNPDLCTLETCPLDMASIEYVPLLWANILFMAIFGAAAVAQLGLGIYYKTWTFMVAIVIGLVGEVVGYYGRVELHNNIFDGDAFLEYLVCLTIAPALLTAAIYLCLSRIVVAFGEKISFFKPRTYTITFITFDFIALLLQAIGGAMASTADDGDQATTDMGINIMIAGLAWQVASLLIFTGMATHFFLRVRKAPNADFNPDFDDLRRKPYFKASLYGLAVATIVIIVRSVYRCAELSEGFDGHLANDEVTFMILEATMIGIAVICLTVFHPGAVWKGQWANAVWHTRAGKGKGGNYAKAASMDAEAISLQPTTYPPTFYAPTAYNGGSYNNTRHA